jgi:hypothetical protein
MRAFWIAVSLVNGGNGGRDMMTSGCGGTGEGYVDTGIVDGKMLFLPDG